MEEPADCLHQLLAVLEGRSSQKPYLFGLPPQIRMLPLLFWPPVPGMPGDVVSKFL